MKANRSKYFLAALVAVVIWGFFAIPLRLISDYKPEDILYYRVFISLIITWIAILIFRIKILSKNIADLRADSRKERKRLIWLTIFAGLLITGNWFTYIYAVNEVSLTSAAFAYMVCPLVTAIGGFFILKERLSKLQLVALGLAAISIIVLSQGSAKEVLWSVLIASLYAFYLIIQRVMGKVDKLVMLGIHLLIATLVILPLFLSDFQALPVNLHFWLIIILISVVFTIVPLFLSLYALIGMPSSTLGIIIYLNPIVAFAVAFFYFHEGINSHQLYAYTTLAVAVVVFNWSIIKELVKRPAE